MTADFSDLLDGCEDTLGLIEAAYRGEDWEALARLSWSMPDAAPEPSPEARDRLLRMIDMNAQMRRALGERMQAIRQRLDETSHVRRATTAYLRVP